MKTYDRYYFSQEQLECIEGIKRTYKENSDYMADAGVVTSWFINCVSVDTSDNEYNFRKISEYAVDEHTVVSKTMVGSDDGHEKMEPFIMYTKGNVHHTDKVWMDFEEIEPICFRKLCEMDAIEWMIKRDIWDELDWHKQNSFLDMEVMTGDLKLLGYLND